MSSSAPYRAFAVVGTFRLTAVKQMKPANGAVGASLDVQKKQLISTTLSKLRNGFVNRTVE